MSKSKNLEMYLLKSHTQKMLVEEFNVPISSESTKVCSTDYPTDFEIILLTLSHFVCIF